MTTIQTDSRQPESADQPVQAKALTVEQRADLDLITKCDPSWLIASVKEHTIFDTKLLAVVFDLAKDQARAQLASQPSVTGAYVGDCSELPLHEYTADETENGERWLKGETLASAQADVAAVRDADLTNEQIQLFFFRDLTEAHRVELFRKLGVDWDVIEEMDSSRGKQRRMLQWVLNETGSSSNSRQLIVSALKSAAPTAQPQADGMGGGGRCD